MGGWAGLRLRRACSCAPPLPPCRQQTLFSGVEENLCSPDSGGEPGDAGEGEGAAGGPSCSGSDCAETAPLDRSKAGAAGGGGGGGSSQGGAELKKSHSEQFLASHLMRASVLPPNVTAGGGGGGEEPNGSVGAAGGEAAELGEGEGGEGDDNAAAGMGCTAVSVLVRGDHVLVANTGGRVGERVCLAAPPSFPPSRLLSTRPLRVCWFGRVVAVQSCAGAWPGCRPWGCGARQAGRLPLGAQP